jgi:hypothetical protein
MKTKSLGLILVLCFFSCGACFADAFTGTWKLDPAKSRMHRAPRNYWVVYQGNPFSWTKVTVKGRDAKGNETYNEWTGFFDGKAYRVDDAADEDMRAYTRVDDHTLNFMSIKDGKAVLRGRIVVAPDGKSRTVTTWHHVWRNHHRKTIKDVAYYDRV